MSSDDWMRSPCPEVAEINDEHFHVGHNKVTDDTTP